MNSVMPYFLKILFTVELFERISYYGVRTLLVLFLIDKYGFQDINAYTIYSIFAALAYSSPVLSGYLADKIFGFRYMIKLGGLIIAIAHILILSSLYDSFCFFLGLGLLVLGTGFFKANINNLLGACYEKNEENRTHGFTVLHVGVNIGSALASILCGYIAHYYGWYYGFGIAFLAILISLGLFLKYENHFGNHGLSPNSDLLKRKYFGFSVSKLAFLASILIGLGFGKIMADNLFSANIFYFFGLIMLCVYIYIIIKSDMKKELIALAFLMICLIIFFAMEMQIGSLFVLFSERNVVQTLFGYNIPATVSQSLNPISIIIVGFIITSRKKNSKNKYEITKFIAGILTTTVCFAALYYGCLNANSENRVAYIYFLLAVFMIGLGELIVWPFVQSKITELSPKNLRGFIMGLVMLFMAFANVLGIWIGKFFAIDSKHVHDSANSLAIYAHGFKMVAIYNVLFTVLFLPAFYFIKKVINKS